MTTIQNKRVHPTVAHQRTRGLVLGFVFFIAGLLTPVQGTVYFIDQNATGTPEDGSSWTCAFRTITNATTKATPGNEFWVAKGTYTSANPLGMEVKNNTFYGGFTNGMLSFSQRDWTNNRTVLDGGNANRVLQKTFSGALTIDGFVIQNGTNTAPGGAFSCVNGAEFYFRNCIISNNTSGGAAGFFYMNASKSLCVFSNCTFAANGATTAGGVMSFNKGDSTNEFYNCVFVGNTAKTTGGAINEGQAGTVLRFKDCLFSNNVAGTDGGAIYDSSSSAKLRISDCVFVTNTATGNGGALRATCSMSLANCDFINNWSKTSGGALCRVSATHNTNYYWNCLFAGNICSSVGSTTGGGAIIDNPSAFVILTTYISNCTFLANTATNGSYGTGGAMRGGSAGSSTSIVYVVNSIFSGNTATSVGTDFRLGSISELNVSYCDIGTNSTAISGGIKNIGLGIIEVDPNFVSTNAPYNAHLLSTAGRWDPALGQWVTDAVGSPCIDAGDPASDYSLEPANNGGRINLGRYGNTLYASKSGAAPSRKGSLILLK